MPRWLRVRIRYFALAVGTILLGLAVHLRGGALSPDARDILGDALWAAMAAWWIAAIAPAIGLSWRATMALAFCLAIEFSQLVHVPALDTLRRTTVGHLALGSGFDLRDFASYTAGVLAAVPGRTDSWLVPGRAGQRSRRDQIRGLGPVTRDRLVRMTRYLRPNSWGTSRSAAPPTRSSWSRPAQNTNASLRNRSRRSSQQLAADRR